MKILVSIVPLFVVFFVVAIGAYVKFFVMMVLMNGFSGSDAALGIKVFTAWAFVFTALSGIAAALFCLLFSRNERRHVLSALGLSILAGTALGFIINSIGVVAALLITTIVWSM